MEARMSKKLCADELEPASLCPTNGSHFEADDFYFRVIARLNDRFRLIRCKDGIQWIILKRDGCRNGKPRWQGHSYCVRPETVHRLVLKHCGIFDVAKLKKVQSLARGGEYHDN